MTAHPNGESDFDTPQLNFDHHLKLEFHGSVITSDAALLSFRELDNVLGRTEVPSAVLSDGRTRAIC